MAPHRFLQAEEYSWPFETCQDAGEAYEALTYSQRIESGEPLAQAIVDLCGKEIERDNENAEALYFYGDALRRTGSDSGRFYLETAARMENPRALKMFADIALNNSHLSPEYAKHAFEWLTKAAAQGDIEAKARMAFMIYEGNGTPQNKEKGRNMLRKQAEYGNREAIVRFSSVLLAEGRVPESLDLLKSIASKDYPVALFDYGHTLNRRGEQEGTKRKGLAMMTEAAKTGNWYAMFSLGMYFLDGPQLLNPESRTKNIENAKFWLCRCGEGCKRVIKSEIDPIYECPPNP